jgi:hypothetical protein
VAASIVAAPLAHIAPPNKERLETCTDVTLQTFIMIISHEMTENGDSRKTLDLTQTYAFSASLENCRDGIDRTPMLESCN